MRLILASLAVAGVLAGCAVGRDALLGGRQSCWPESEERLATVMKGTLELDPERSKLATPEGEDFLLEFPVLVVKTVAGDVAIVDGSGAALATDGDLVTVFGGLGSNGVITVCAIEERHNG